MSTKFRLLAGAAVGLLAATSISGAAQAATKHRAHGAASSAADKAKIRDLESRLEELEAKFAAQQQAQVQAQSQAQQAQAQAAQAQAAAQAAADQARAVQAQTEETIKTIPAEVKTEVAAAKPKPGWEANTKVTGRMYFDLSNIEMKRDGQKISPSGVGFDMKRFYVGIDHNFNDVFSGNVTTDVTYNSAESLTQVYVKKAYLQAKLNPMLTIRLGSADLPWIPYAEDMYGYRFVENTVADRTKFGTSADWGAHALGKVGIFSYQVSVVNGGGYKNLTRSKSMDVEGRISTEYKGFNLAVGGYSGKLGKNIEGGAPTFHTAQRFNVLAAYVNPRFRVGVEYFSASNWNNVTTATEDRSDGVSLFGNVNLTPKVSVFGRWDNVNPTKRTKPSEEDNYFNVGVNFEPVKIVDLALVYKRDKVDDGLLSTSNGTIGSSILGSDGTYDEVGLFGQFRW